MIIKTDKDKRNLISQAQKKLQILLEEHRDNPILFLTSGGSAFDLLQNLKIPEGLKISIGVLDERFSTDKTINNFAQFRETPFFKENELRFENILDTAVTVEDTLEEFSERFEAMLRTWMVENPQGRIVATIGMGPDGHTSGMMPFPEDPDRLEKLFNDSRRLVVGYDAGDKNQYRERTTTTMEFMRRIHHGVAYITGEGKREAWNRVVADTGTLAETPARILRDMEDVRVFTDLDGN